MRCVQSTEVPRLRPSSAGRHWKLLTNTALALSQCAPNPTVWSLSLTILRPVGNWQELEDRNFLDCKHFMSEGGKRLYPERRRADGFRFAGQAVCYFAMQRLLGVPNADCSTVVLASM